jgi:hypothetical protein
MAVELTEYEIIQKHLAAHKQVRQPWEPLWKDITNYVLPRRSFWDIDATPGKKPATKVFDGTAIAALQLLVDGLLGYLVSPKIKWFRLGMERRELQDVPYVADWLEAVEDVLYAEFSKSNFYEAMSEFFLDAASIGTAVMLVEDDVKEGRILYSTRHMKEVYIAESRTGMVDTLYREYQITNRQAFQEWGNKLCQQRIEQTEQNPFGKTKIIHAVYPRTDREYGKIDSVNKPWASAYYDVAHSEKIDVGGFDSFPYLVWRWRKNSDEVYGRSPAADAIQDIIRINQMGKTALQAGQLAVEPPLNVPKEMKGLERIVPRGYNYYTNPKATITPINLGQNYPWAKEEEQEVREQIRDIFRTRIFVLMEMLEGSNKTATEIREIQGEKAAVLGATIGRLNSETLIPLIDRNYEICDKNGLIPPPPEVLGGGGRVKIEFQGPLAQAQKRYHESQGVIAGTQFIGGLREMFPESLDNVDADELMRVGMDSQGMPQGVIREKPEVKQIREIRQKAQEQEKQEAIAIQEEALVAQNANKLNEPVKPGSLMEAIGKKAAG